MNLKEMREMKVEDLRTHLSEQVEKIFRLRCTSERVSPQQGAEIKILRREIAQARTLLRQRQQADELPGQMQDVEDNLVPVASGKRTLASRRRAEKLRNRRRYLKRVQRELDFVKRK